MRVNWDTASEYTTPDGMKIRGTGGVKQVEMYETGSRVTGVTSLSNENILRKAEWHHSVIMCISEIRMWIIKWP